MQPKPQSTQGYAEQAHELIARYESEPFEHKHAAVLNVLPTRPGWALDVGAGTGADASWLASKGHRVIAAEPTAAFRQAGRQLHPDPRIDWVDDGLPGLQLVRARKQKFDLIMLSAVWMHLEREEREEGMKTLALLLAPGGVMVLSLRHGPVPQGRRMFEVTGAETIELASRLGLGCVLNVLTESAGAINQAAGITWTRLAFKWEQVS